MEHLIIERLLQILLSYERRLYAYTADLALSFTSKYGISPGTALSIVVGCVCVYMFLLKRRGGSTTRRFLQRSRSLAALYGGELALGRMNDYREAQMVPETLDNAEVLLEALLKEEHLDLKKLQVSHLHLLLLFSFQCLIIIGYFMETLYKIYLNSPNYNLFGLNVYIYIYIQFFIIMLSDSLM